MKQFRNIFGFQTSPVKGLNEAPNLKQNIKAFANIPKLIFLVWQTHRGFTLATIILRLLRTSIPIGTLYVAKLLIDEVIKIIQNPQHNHSFLWTLIIIEFCFMLFSELLNRLVSLIESLLGDLFSNKSSVVLMQHAATLDLSQFEDATFYDKLSRARQQTIGRVTLMSQVLSQMQDCITLLALGFGLIFFNAWLILILIIAVIPSFFSETYFNNSSYSLVKSWTPQRRELDYLRLMGASDQSAKEVKIFGLSDFIIKRFSQLSDTYYLANRSLSIRRAIWGIVFSGLGSVGYYIAYSYIVWQTLQGKLSIGDLTFLAGSFGRMQGLLQGILTRFSGMAQSVLYLQDLFDFLKMKPNIYSPLEALSMPKPIQKGFIFEDVGFKYPNSEVWAVRHLSFELKAGEKLALVGENGAGKTTITKLISRLYLPDEGKILLDGHNINDYNLELYQKEIGVIFQDFLRFQMTAGTNIAVGKIESQDDNILIAKSAMLGLADSVIEKLPKKYDQLLGKSFKDGVEISGGEWQKIAIARAYMRNAQLLVLDEPTAALDARAEFEVFKRFTELTESKSAILISHRFSTVRIADRILVLQRGRMLALGSHEQLLAQGGLYAELFNLQAEGYK